MFFFWLSGTITSWAIRLIDAQQNIYIYMCALKCLLFSQHMLRVSFLPGRDRACRHCWICSLLTPLKNGHCVQNNTLDNTWTNIKITKKRHPIPEHISKNPILICWSKVRCGGVSMVSFLPHYEKIYNITQSHNFKTSSKWPPTLFLRLLAFFNGRQT